MASDRDVTNAGGGSPTEAITGRQFGQVRRGYDPAEVRRFQAELADEVARLQARADDLAARLAQAEEQAAHPVVSEEAVVAAVGDEMATILRSAHGAASDLRARAADEAQTLVAEARTQAETVRGEADEHRARAEVEGESRLSAARSQAETLVARAAEEADAVLEAARQSANAEATQITAKSRADAESYRHQAEQERRLTIEGAQAIRERILGDLARRRRVATVQIEQLRAGRERLLESYGVVRRTLEEVHDELQRADAEARAAADEAGRRLEGETVDPATGPPDGPPPATADGAAPDDVPAATGERPAPDGAPAAPGDTPEPDGARSATGEGPPPDARPRPPLASGDAPAPPAPPAATADGDAPPVDAPPSPAPVTDAPIQDSTGHDSTATDAPVTGGSGQDPPLVDAPGGASPVAAPAAVPTPTAQDATPRPTAGRVGASAGRERVRLVRVGRMVPAAGPTAGSAPAPTSAGGGRLRVLSGAAAAALEEAEDEAVATPPVANLELVADEAGAHEDAVGTLFDRIRAGRERSVADARRVLGGSEAPAPPDTAVGPADDDGARAPGDGDAPGDGAGTDHHGDEAAPGDEAGTHHHHHGDATSPGDDAGTDHHGDATSPGEARSDADENELQRRDAELEEFVSGLARRLKRALQDEHNDLLDRLRGIRGGPTLDAVLGDGGEQTGRYAAAAEPFVRRAAAAGAPSGDATAIVETVTARGTESVAAAVVEPLRRRLDSVLTERGGDSGEALVDALASVYRETRSHRIEPLAIDTLTAVHAEAAWTAAPDGTAFRWIAEDAGGPCPDCDDNVLAGPVTKGDEFPTGQLYPPAHRGCHCLLVADPA